MFTYRFKMDRQIIDSRKYIKVQNNMLEAELYFYGETSFPEVFYRVTGEYLPEESIANNFAWYTRIGKKMIKYNKRKNELVFRGLFYKT